MILHPCVYANPGEKSYRSKNEKWVFPTRIDQIDGIVLGIGLGILCIRDGLIAWERILRQEATRVRIIETGTKEDEPGSVLLPTSERKYPVTPSCEDTGAYVEGCYRLLEVANLHMAIPHRGFLSRSRDGSMLLPICMKVKVWDKHHSVN